MGFPGIVLCFAIYVFGVIALMAAANGGLINSHTHRVIGLILDVFGGGFLLWLAVGMVDVRVRI